jgi:hypothetical protein
MKVKYVCEYCSKPIAEIETNNLDRLGITNLTDEEKADIIKIDENGTMIVNSFCDDCINDWGIGPEIEGNIQFSIPKYFH